jgi:hypothetical protein
MSASDVALAKYHNYEPASAAFQIGSAGVSGGDHRYPDGRRGSRVGVID